MKAMILNKICDLRENKNPLELVEVPSPEPKEDEILIKVSRCGVCHTELDEIEGTTTAEDQWRRLAKHEEEDRHHEEDGAPTADANGPFNGLLAQAGQGRRDSAAGQVTNVGRVLPVTHRCW